MYSLAPQQQPSPEWQLDAARRSKANEVSALQTEADLNRATFHQFNQHILLTVQAVNQMKTIFDVRGA